jgi:hypothetical protein
MDRFSITSALFLFAAVLCNPVHASASEIAPQGVRVVTLKAGGNPALCQLTGVRWQPLKSWEPCCLLVSAHSS